MEQRKQKILQFEDEPVLLSICKLKFLENGFDYKEFTTYDNFIEIVAAEKPDLVICDILMPGMNGYDAIKMLKKDERTKNVPCVIFTNLYGDFEVKKGLDAGAVKFLFKQQFGPNEFIEEIKNILRQQKDKAR